MEEEDFIVGAKKVTKNINSDKHDFKQCVQSFKQHFIDEFDLNYLINCCFSSQVDKLTIRSTLWRIFLKAIPNNQNYNDWIDKVTDDRKIFKEKLKEFNNFKKMTGDPLGGINESDSGWNSFFKDNELKKLINLDVNRTYQDKEMFQTTFIKELMTTILFIWSKENSDVSYRQGMNEVLAVILLAIFPFYHKEKAQNISNIDSFKEKINQLKTEGKLDSLANELYLFLNNESELQADLYTLFNSIMQRGVLELYRTALEETSKKEVFAGKKKDLFHIQYQDETPMKLENTKTDKEISFLQKRCNKIYKEYLKTIDQELFNYMIQIDIDATIFLVRWLKCILNREFHHGNVIIIWDAILSNDLKESLEIGLNVNIPSNQLNLLDFVCVSMITYLREEILRKDQVECLQRLFKYPPLESPNILIKASVNMKEKIYKKFFKIKEKKFESKKESRQQSSSTFKVENDSFFDSNKLKHAKYDSEITNNTVTDSGIEKKSFLEDIEKLERILEKYSSMIQEEDKNEIAILVNKFKLI